MSLPSKILSVALFLSLIYQFSLPQVQLIRHVEEEGWKERGGEERERKITTEDGNHCEPTNRRERRKYRKMYHKKQ